MATNEADQAAASADLPIPTSFAVDAAVPEVTAVYLRPVKPAAAEAGRDGRGRYANENLADAITRIVSGMLERDLRDSVTAAVRALAPRLVVSLPPDPPADAPGPAPVPAQPSAAPVGSPALAGHDGIPSK